MHSCLQSRQAPRCHPQSALASVLNGLNDCSFNGFFHWGRFRLHLNCLPFISSQEKTSKRISQTRCSQAKPISHHNFPISKTLYTRQMWCEDVYSPNLNATFEFLSLCWEMFCSFHWKKNSNFHQFVNGRKWKNSGSMNNSQGPFGERHSRKIGSGWAL